MSDNSGASPKKPSALMKILLAVVFVGALVVGGIYLYHLLFAPPDEEPPIVVKNGSMDITIGQGQWVPDDPINPGGYVPSGGQSHDRYDVKVDQGTGVTCEDNWNGLSGNVNKIDVSYTDKFSISVKSMNPAGKNKTQVSPINGLNPDPSNPATLRHDAPGFIDSVTVHVVGGGKPLNCYFDKRAATAIHICPPGHPACK
jgi:hypothetical protein